MLAQMLSGFGGRIDIFLATMLTIFLSAALRGFAGFGFAVIALPLMSFLLPAADTVPLVSCLGLLVGLFDLPRARKNCHWPSLRWLLAGAVVGAPLGTMALAVASPRSANLAVALICAAGSLALAKGFTFRVEPRPAASGFVGLVAGVIGGLAAVPGPPVVAFYLALPLKPEQIRDSIVVFIFCTSIVTIIGLVTAGLLTARFIIPSLLGAPLIILGTLAGRHIFKRFHGRLHRAISIGLLGFIALAGLVRAAADFIG